MIQIIGSKLSQWDVGRRVSVSGDATHVHFANRGDSEAVIMEITNGEAKIPDYLFRTGKDLFAYAVKDGVTLGSKAFAVRNREKPENYIYEDDQRNYIYELIESVEDAIAEAERVTKEMETQIADTAEAAKQANESAKQAEAAAVTAAESAVTAAESSAEAKQTANEAKETAEQTEANLIDKLCPNINESGSIVACEPVEGYPLTVQADEATKVYRCGKNLLGPTISPQTTNGITATVDEDGTIHLNGTATANAWFYITPTYPLPIADYVLSAHDYAPTADVDNFGFQYQNNTHNVFGLTGAGATVRSYTENQIWRVEFRVPSGKTLNDYTMRIQIELGTVATAFERYRGVETFTLGETIPTLDGGNTIWADSGDVSVSGKADPKALFDKLTKAILSLGGNV